MSTILSGVGGPQWFPIRRERFHPVTFACMAGSGISKGLVSLAWLERQIFISPKGRLGYRQRITGGPAFTDYALDCACLIWESGRLPSNEVLNMNMLRSNFSFRMFKSSEGLENGFSSSEYCTQRWRGLAATFPRSHTLIFDMQLSKLWMVFNICYWVQGLLFIASSLLVLRWYEKLESEKDRLLIPSSRSLSSARMMVQVNLQKNWTLVMQACRFFSEAMGQRTSVLKES